MKQFITVALIALIPASAAFTPQKLQHHHHCREHQHYMSQSMNDEVEKDSRSDSQVSSRKTFMNTLISSTMATLVGIDVLGQHPQPALADSRPETLDIDNFLRTGECVLVFVLRYFDCCMKYMHTIYVIHVLFHYYLHMAL